jgi:hypothetical protein
MSIQREWHDAFGTGPDAYSDSFDATATAVAERSVTVVHGVHAHEWPIVGMTVGQARGELAERMNIDPAAIAVVDGREVTDDTILAEGQVLNFVKHAGEKGKRHE